MQKCSWEGLAIVSYCEGEEGERYGIIWKVLTPETDGCGSSQILRLVVAGGCWRCVVWYLKQLTSAWLIIIGFCFFKNPLYIPVFFPLVALVSFLLLDVLVMLSSCFRGQVTLESSCVFKREKVGWEICTHRWSLWIDGLIFGCSGQHFGGL